MQPAVPEHPVRQARAVPVTPREAPVHQDHPARLMQLPAAEVQMLRHRPEPAARPKWMHPTGN